MLSALVCVCVFACWRVSLWSMVLGALVDESLSLCLVGVCRLTAFVALAFCLRGLASQCIQSLRVDSSVCFISALVGLGCLFLGSYVVLCLLHSPQQGPSRVVDSLNRCSCAHESPSVCGLTWGSRPCRLRASVCLPDARAICFQDASQLSLLQIWHVRAMCASILFVQAADRVSFSHGPRTSALFPTSLHYRNMVESAPRIWFDHVLVECSRALRCRPSRRARGGGHGPWASVLH